MRAELHTSRSQERAGQLQVSSRAAEQQIAAHFWRCHCRTHASALLSSPILLSGMHECAHPLQSHGDWWNGNKPKKRAKECTVSRLCVIACAALRLSRHLHRAGEREHQTRAAYTRMPAAPPSGAHTGGVHLVPANACSKHSSHSQLRRCGSIGAHPRLKLPERKVPLCAMQTAEMNKAESERVSGPPSALHLLDEAVLSKRACEHQLIFSFHLSTSPRSLSLIE